ncbi:Tensin-3 [Camelus dromedarius]|uniref:Tensin-3 n=1 Tax=Camelus dromedarius TaxID=9838 RepID=A0A5N4C4E2_CAMDR|nr:Tensin-3 [Camelus dromedarius]
MTVVKFCFADNPGEKQVTVNFVQDTSKFWYKADISRDKLNKKAGDLANELVRHFLIECTPKGVRLKGAPTSRISKVQVLASFVLPVRREPEDLVCQLHHAPGSALQTAHSDRDPLEEKQKALPRPGQLATELLKQGAGLFFRRHYPVSSVIFCALDPQDRKWITDGPSSRVFGFVARKQGSATDNVCHLFAEHDPEQPASAIVNFVSKVMIGSPRKI